MNHAIKTAQLVLAPETTNATRAFKESAKSPVVIPVYRMLHSITSTKVLNRSENVTPCVKNAPDPISTIASPARIPII